MKELTVEEQKVFDILTTKPQWMKDAVLGVRGWYHAVTGELLLGRRTPEWVLERVAELKAAAESVETEVEMVTTEVEAKVEEVVAEVEAKVTKRGKKKAVETSTDATVTTEEAPVAETVVADATVTETPAA